MDNHLKEVQKTLLMPLWGRAKLSRLGNPVLNDPKAVELVEHLKEVDFVAIDRAFSDFFNAGWIVRARMFDDTIRTFLADSPDGTVVNLGAGLDTTFFRVDNGRLVWVDLDLPDVIELRKTLIPETERQMCFAGSLFEQGWMDKLNPRGKRVLFLAGGVLYYFTEEQVKGLFRGIADHFPGSEMVFDTISHASIPFINKGLQASENEAVLVHWGIDDIRTIAGWDGRLRILEIYPMFSRIEDKAYWGPIIAAYMAKSDTGKASSIVHVKFGL